MVCIIRLKYFWTWFKIRFRFRFDHTVRQFFHIRINSVWVKIRRVCKNLGMFVCPKICEGKSILKNQRNSALLGSMLPITFTHSLSFTAVNDTVWRQHIRLSDPPLLHFKSSPPWYCSFVHQWNAILFSWHCPLKKAFMLDQTFPYAYLLVLLSINEFIV